MQPLPSQAHDFFYSQAMEALGLADLSKEERIDKLLTLPYMEIIGKLPPGQPAMPLLDGDIVKWAPTFKGMNDFSQVSENDLPGKNWCEAILLGDCQFDVCTPSVPYTMFDLIKFWHLVTHYGYNGAKQETKHRAVPPSFGTKYSCATHFCRRQAPVGLRPYSASLFNIRRRSLPGFPHAI